MSDDERIFNSIRRFRESLDERRGQRDAKREWNREHQ